MNAVDRGLRASALMAMGSLLLAGSVGCGAAAQLKGPEVGRYAKRTMTTTYGPSRIVDAEELEAAGLPNTGDALRRRIPFVY